MPENPCPAGTSEYYVKPGDTVYRIVQNAGTTVAAIMNANPGLNPNQLYPGQRICVPGSACPGGFIYTVKPGDTFYNIAINNRLTQAELAAANPGVDPLRLMVGQQICIPKGPVIPSQPPVPLPCCLLLEPNYYIPQTALHPIGSVVTRKLAPEVCEYLIAAILPDPRVQSDFDSYAALISFGTPQPTPPTLVNLSHDKDYYLWGGSIVEQLPTIDGTVVIQPINSTTLKRGPGVIGGSFRQCCNKPS